MSFKAIKIENNLTRTLLASTLSEIETLPTSTTIGTGGLTSTDNEKVAIGSRAICIEDWSKWVLTPNNTWSKVPKSSSSTSGDGSSSSGEDVSDIITDDEIDDIISSLN